MDQHNSVSSLAGLQITLGPLDRPYMHTVRFVNTFDWAWKVTKRGRIENSSKHGLVIFLFWNGHVRLKELLIWNIKKIIKKKKEIKDIFFFFGVWLELKRNPAHVSTIVKLLRKDLRDV